MIKTRINVMGFEGAPTRISNDLTSGRWPQGGHVLLIDTNLAAQDRTARMLVQLGLVPLLVIRMQQGLALLREARSITCVVVNLSMPHLHGAQLRTVAPDIPILGMCIPQSAHQASHCSTMWFDGLLIAPFTRSELWTALRPWLSHTPYINSYMRA